VSSWVLLVFVIMANEKRGGTVGFGLGVSSWDYLLTQCSALTHYLRQTVWPDRLVLDFGEVLATGLQEVWKQGVVIVLLLISISVLLIKGSAWALPGVWFFVILAPSSSFVPLTTQTIAEHRMYLPLAALAVIFVIGIYESLGRHRFWMISILGFCVGLTYTTWQRNELYQNTINIWKDTVEKVPENYRAWNNLTTAYISKLRLSEALASAQEALRLRPTSASVHNNLGFALLMSGKLDEAIPRIKTALVMDPRLTVARDNLGLGLLKSGKNAEAIPEFELVLKKLPDRTSTRVNLGEALYRMEKLDQAEEQWRIALNDEPGNVEALCSLGNLLLRRGQAEDSNALIKRA
jgi:tetratricopeptide (TPR) repeat protein